MNNSKRVFINTLAQYGRTVFNMLLSLYTVRLVLETLGASDYGIYTIIAGVTSMLAFMTNALVSTTQRFLSFYQGKKNLEKTKEVFNNSELLHLIIGLLFVIILYLLTPFLFNGFLNIPIERVVAAKKVYYIVIAILFITFCNAPFRALLVSHENIVYISIIDMLDGILKMVLVSILPYVNYDKLVVYSDILLFLQIFNFLAFSIFSFIKYDECIFPKFKYFNKTYILELFSYAGWVIYGMGCIMGRSQGIAIVLNRFLGTVANAAYGLGFQISNAVSTVSTAFLNAMRPQIIKSEGAGDRSRTLRLSCMLCKFSFFLLSAICIPVCFEAEELLQLWLKEVPQYTVLFVRMALIAGMVDTLTLGLSVANEAIGNIRNYNLAISTMKLATLPLIWICLKFDLDLVWVAIMYILIEILSAFMRVPFLHKTGGLNVVSFLKNNIFRELLSLAVLILVEVLLVSCIQFPNRFLISIPISIILYIGTIILMGLDNSERYYLLSLLKKKQHNG